MKRLGIAALVVAVIGVVGGALAPTAPAAEGLTLSQLNGPPLPPSLTSAPQMIESAVPPPNVTRSEIQAQVNYSGGTFTSSGRTLRMYLSDSYKTDNAWLQGWADWITHTLIYGSELEAATFYFLTNSEVAELCGSNAYACYFPSSQLLVLPGSSPADGTTIQAVVAHEYGHHIARNRSNAPWTASDTGPKRWASAMNVCSRTADGTAFPGNEGGNYWLNPGEAFAETYSKLIMALAAVDDLGRPAMELQRDLHAHRSDLRSGENGRSSAVARNAHVDVLG